jgi:hypothetical protein
MDKIIGRKKEQEELRKVLESGEAAFLAVLWTTQGREDIPDPKFL